LAGLLPGGEVWGVDASAEQLSRANADLPNLHFDQACPHFDALWQPFVRLQSLLGGDSLIANVRMSQGS
jgi:hypothetical protein